MCVLQSIVSVLVRLNRVADAQEFALTAAQDAPSPDDAVTVFTALLNALLAQPTKMSTELRAAIAEYTNRQLPQTPALQQTLLAVQATLGDVDAIQRLLREMIGVGLEPSGAALRTMTTQLARLGQGEKAATLLALIENGLPAQEQLSNALLHCYASLGRLHDAERLLQTVRSSEFKPDAYALAELLDAYSRAGAVDHATGLLSVLRSENGPLNAHAFFAVAQAYLHNRQIDAATRMLHAAQRAATIHSARFVRRVRDLCVLNDVHGAVDLLRRLQCDGVRPSPYILQALAWAQLRSHQPAGAEVSVREMIELGYRPPAALLNGLLTGMRSRGCGWCRSAWRR